jgi:uncharacterized protein YfaS (alpha-2-macroglobulin family)
LAKFVPNLLTADALKKLGIPTEQFAADFPKMVKAGLDRLYTLQREGGGWGWFDNDAVDPFMTACAVAGLNEAKRLGYAVDAVRLEEGESCLRRLAKEEKDMNRLACICLALSRGSVPPEVERLAANPDKLGPYALAATAQALHRWGLPQAADFRRRLVDARVNGHWKTTGWYYKWEDVTIETTALAVSALSESDPAHPAIAPAVEWLLAQRQGNRWRSTKDTAAAIHAILGYAVATGGKLDSLSRAVERKDQKVGAPQIMRKVRLTLNGVSKELLVDLNNPASSRFECHFAGRDLKSGENRIGFTSQDDFEFELEGVLRTTGGPSTPGKRFSITTSTDKPLSHARLGGEVVVTVTVQGDADYDYVMVEAPIPAGCEIIRGSGEGAFSRFEARYEQAIFYLRAAGTAPTVLRFRMRAGFAGRYTSLAPMVSVMYDERLSGLGKSSTAVIGP